ncbi:hypothetical protein ACF0H5_006938 [Mactra antiquata]
MRNFDSLLESSSVKSSNPNIPSKLVLLCYGINYPNSVYTAADKLKLFLSKVHTHSQLAESSLILAKIETGHSVDSRSDNMFVYRAVKIC